MIVDIKKLGIKDINSGCYIGENGRWTTKTDKSLIESFNPTTGELLGSVAPACEEDYEKLVIQMQKVQQHWRTVPPPQRGELIRQIGNELRFHKDELGSLISLEMGKTKSEGDGEVQEMIDMADLAVGQSRMLYGNTMHSERPQHRMYEQWQPLGVVGVISAFNFPMAVWAWNAFLAAIAGNTVIWKPSSKVPLCAIAVIKIINKLMVNKGHPFIFGLFISSDNELKEKFISDKRIPLISFTGSTAVGRQVNETVSKRFGRCLLELGGNNAIIVAEDADLNLAVPAIVFGAVGTAGQRCTSTRRVIVHENIQDKLIGGLVNAYKQIKIGDPLKPKTLLGPLIDEGAVDSFKRAIAEIKYFHANRGGIIMGGEIINRDGNFVQPTLVLAENDWDIVQQETFAPILYIITYTELDEAIRIQNNVPQGLSSAIFTQDLKTAEQFLSASGSDCGIANVNIGTSGAEIGGAFGGEKETGGGREAGSDAWKAYMRRQTNTINWSDELPMAQGIKFDL